MKKMNERVKLKSKKHSFPSWREMGRVVRGTCWTILGTLGDGNVSSWRVLWLHMKCSATLQGVLASVVVCFIVAAMLLIEIHNIWTLLVVWWMGGAYPSITPSLLFKIYLDHISYVGHRNYFFEFLFLAPHIFFFALLPK